MSLYDGRLVKTETELFFIAERFSGWEIMEGVNSKSRRSEMNESFMGKVVEIHTSPEVIGLSKNFQEGISIDQWLNGSNQLITEPQSTQADLNADEKRRPSLTVIWMYVAEDSIISAVSPTVQPHPKS